jgi:peroxiredoxin Q/BCP
MKLTIGQSAPDFSLPDQNGQAHTLAQYRNRWVLLYFYPKDNTPGCTMEACGLRDAWPDFGKLDTVVLGVSTDSVASHKKFAEKYHLPFTLLADEQKVVVKMYEVWAPKKFLGKEYLGTKRVSFLIDPSGKIVKIYDPVKPAAHTDEVKRDLDNLRLNK